MAARDLTPSPARDVPASGGSSSQVHSLFVAVCLRAPSEKKKDGRLTLSRFRKMKGMGESSAPEPATGEAVPEDASVAAPALI